MDIIIVGAGAAGLMAARKLSLSHQVTILEAAEVTGGRIRTIRNLEGGAEFVHGNLPLTMSILKDAKLSFKAMKGSMSTVQNQQWHQDEEIIPGWDSLLQQMGQITDDLTLNEFLDIYYPGDENAHLRSMTVKYAEGFDLADASKVSVRALYDEWNATETDNYHLDRGYGAMIDYLTNQCIDQACQLLTNSCVSEISLEDGKVTAKTTDSNKFSADKVIVTVPLGILQQAKIRFDSSADKHLAAANKLGWGSVIKIVLRFDRPFWEDHSKDIGFIFSDEAIPTWWTRSPASANILTGWLGGPSSLNHKNEDLLELAIHSLSNIFQLEKAELLKMLVDSLCIDWSREPFVGGAYCYDSLYSSQAREILRTPVENTLYFAGEAIYTGQHIGTVEAALVSGDEVAQMILNDRN
jgi:monoamine oxidase